MAVSDCTGAESGSAPTGSSDLGEIDVDGTSGVAISSAVKHNGNYSWRFLRTVAGGTMGAQLSRPDSAGTGVSLYMSCRLWIRIDTLWSVNSNSVYIRNGASPTQRLLINSTGTISVAPTTSGASATSSNALTADAQWHSIEWDNGYNAGAGSRVYVDGVLWVNADAMAVSAGTNLNFGFNAGSTSTFDFYIDDVVADDAALNGTLWGNWKCTWMPVVSDSSRGTWTGGAGGTTNLFGALDNIPPVGVAAGSDTDTSQIQSASSTGTDAFDANVQSYSTHGIVAGDTIRAVLALTVTGEGVSTGTKTGDVQIVSNPVAGTRTFQYGGDVASGAVGTYPVRWRGAISQVANSPSVTLATQPVVRVRKTDTGTREAHVALLGIYVIWSPATSKAPPPFQRLWRRQTTTSWR